MQDEHDEPEPHRPRPHDHLVEPFLGGLSRAAPGDSDRAHPAADEKRPKGGCGAFLLFGLGLCAARWLTLARIPHHGASEDVANAGGCKEGDRGHRRRP
jgi:hypothetical protein